MNLIGVESTPTQQTLIWSSMIVKTNTYTNANWRSFLLDPSYSKNRQAKAETFLKQVAAKSSSSELDLYSILKNKKDICQVANQSTDVGTLAFVSRHHFGLGNPYSAPLGDIPF